MDTLRGTETADRERIRDCAPSVAQGLYHAPEAGERLLRYRAGR